MHQDHFGFLRLVHIIGKPAQPAIPAEPAIHGKPAKRAKAAKPAFDPIVPVSKSTWWAGVKVGRFPAPIKLSPGITVWRASDIEALCEKLRAETQAIK